MMVTFTYDHAPALVARHFTETGDKLPKTVSHEIDTADLTPDERALWINWDGSVLTNLKAEVDVFTPWTSTDRTAWEADRIYPDGLTAVRDWRTVAAGKRAEAEPLAREYLVAETAKLQAAKPGEYGSLSDRAKAACRIADAFPEAEAFTVAWEAYREATDAKAAADKEMRRRAEARRQEDEQAAREAAEADREAWIVEHGSDYLKTAHGAGYKIQRTYVTERAAAEHPNYQPDFAQTMEYDERANPSPEALAAAIADGSTVVWATAPPNARDDDYPDEWDAREALVIENYLGKYTLARLNW